MSFLRQIVDTLVYGYAKKQARFLSYQAYEKPSKHKGICWGGGYLPHEAAKTHFSFIGATGSGKTVSIRLLMQTVLPFIGSKANGKTLDHRALIYDPKQDMLSYLEGMSLPCDVRRMSPFDSVSFAWDLAKDITERAHALEFSTILIPPDKNAYQPFFGDAARHLLEGIITSFILRGPDWTFRDVIYAMGTKERIIEVLGKEDETRELIGLYFDHEETGKNIMSTIATKLKPFKIIAALWDKSRKEGRTLSLTEWLDGDKKYILLLGSDETARTAIDSINQAIFKRVTQLILQQHDIDPDEDFEEGVVEEGRIDRRRHWIILDEVRNIGRLDGLTALLTKGRSKGVAVVLGFQDIEGLQSVYGKEEAGELVGQCSNHAVLRLQSPETAEWASRVFGTSEVLEEYTDKSSSASSSVSRGPERTVTTTTGEDTSSSKRISYREVKEVMASQFIYIKPTSVEHGLAGWYLSPYKDDPYGTTIPGKLLFEQWLDRPAKTQAKRREGEDQYLEPWETKERTDLGLMSISRVQKLRKLKDKKKQMGMIAQEIAELAFYEKRQPTNKEIDELVAISAEAVESCKRILDELTGNVKEKKKEGEDNPIAHVTRRTFNIGKKVVPMQ